jgi:hypothetical protein
MASVWNVTQQRPSLLAVVSGLVIGKLARGRGKRFGSLAG